VPGKFETRLTRFVEDRGHYPDDSPSDSLTTDKATAAAWVGRRRVRGVGVRLSFSHNVMYARCDGTQIAGLMVRMGGGKCFVLAGDPYSCRGASFHEAAVAELVRHTPKHVKVFRVQNFHASTYQEHLANLVVLAENLADHGGGGNPKERAELVRRLKAANDYARVVGLPHRLPSLYPAELEAFCRKVRDEHRAEELRRLKAAKEEREKNLADWRKRVEAWKAGKNPGHLRCPYADCPEHHVGYLRWEKGDKKQDILRSIPGDYTLAKDKAIAILAAVRRPTRDGSDRDLSGARTGGYGATVDYKARLVHVGCKAFTFDEVERVARQKKL
jgi:hypothetical protein